MLTELTNKVSGARVQTQVPGQEFSAGEPTITLPPRVPSGICSAMGGWAVLDKLL